MTAAGEHADEIAAQELLLRSVEYLRDLDRVDIARLIGSSEDAHFGPGTVIIREGEVADSLYLLASGTVEVNLKVDGGERSVDVDHRPRHLRRPRPAPQRRKDGDRAAPRRGPGLADPRRPFREAGARATSARSGHRARLATPSIAAIGVESALPSPTRAAPLHDGAPAQAFAAHARHTVAVSIGIPAALWFLPAPSGLSAAGWHIALVMLGGAMGWLLEPVPDFAIALGMAAAWGAAGLAPPSLVFGGFASSAWVTALAALGLTSAMAASGLLFRVALMLLRIFPPTHRGQAAALLAGGVVLTPLVPTVFGRVATIAPVARELSQALGSQSRVVEAPRSPSPRSSATPSLARSS